MYMTEVPGGRGVLKYQVFSKSDFYSSQYKMINDKSLEYPVYYMIATYQRKLHSGTQSLIMVIVILMMMIMKSLHE